MQLKVHFINVRIILYHSWSSSNLWEAVSSNITFWNSLGPSRKALYFIILEFVGDTNTSQMNFMTADDCALVFQAQLRAFIPEMLKYSTGRGKPGWGKESCKPIWWPEDIPWANVRSDVRTEEQKQRVRFL